MMRYLISSTPTWESEDGDFSSFNLELVNSYNKKLIQDGDCNQLDLGSFGQCKGSGEVISQPKTNTSSDISKHSNRKSRQRRVSAVSGEWYRRVCSQDSEWVSNTSWKKTKITKDSSSKQRKSADSNFLEGERTKETNELHLHTELHQCATCGKVAVSKAALRVHQFVHTDDKPHKCETCGSCFKTKGCLRRHKKIHSGERPYKCSYCEKGFANKQQRSCHEATHDKSRRLECETCGRTYSSAGELTRHKRISHSSLGYPHKCQLCAKGYTKLQSLKDHQNEHTGETPYECKVCQKKSSSLNKARQHERSHIPITERPVKCQFCTKGFFYKQEMLNHVKSRHQPRQFKCRVCCMKFMDKKDMEIHRIGHIGEER